MPYKKVSELQAAQLDLHRRHLALTKTTCTNVRKISPVTLMTSPAGTYQSSGRWEDLLDLTADEAYNRKREWNRKPLTDIFPRIPSLALERILDICISKGFTYNLSEAKLWNARRFTAITIAHVRHQCSDYDDLLRQGVERYEARRLSGARVWKVLRDWCPWDAENPVLERCFKATLLPLEQREAEYMFVDDPMDVDSASDFGGDAAQAAGRAPDSAVDFMDDPMDID